MSEHAAALTALARIAAAATPAARAEALADGFVTLGFTGAVCAIASGPRTVHHGRAGSEPLPLLKITTPDALDHARNEPAPPESSAAFPLGADDGIAGYAVVCGTPPPDRATTEAFVGAATALIAREWRIARVASMQRHDLRGPLTVIMGWCELLAEGADEGTRATASTILRQAEKLNALLDEHASRPAGVLGGTAARAERL